jgi:hypothetical protein
MYEYGRSVGLDKSGWFQGRLRSDATKLSLKETSIDLEVDGKMWSEQEERAVEVVTSGFNVSLNLQVKFEVSGFGACSGCPSYKYRSGR